MRVFTNHTESETSVQWALMVVMIIGIVLAIGLHHPWAWAVFALAAIPSVWISGRAVKRRPPTSSG